MTAPPSEPGCMCETCVPQGNPFAGEPMRFIVCAICGNKRCPHATDHRNACTNSNAPGQKGSSYEDCAVPPPSAEPPATDDLVRDLNDWVRTFAYDAPLRRCIERGADTIVALRVVVERQAREIAATNAECVKLRGWVNDAEQAAGKLQAERDALREVVKAADAMRLGLDCPMCDSGKLRNPAKEHWDTCAFANYDAAREKVKP